MRSAWLLILPCVIGCASSSAATIQRPVDPNEAVVAAATASGKPPQFIYPISSDERSSR